ncbi:hypothetical protein ABZ672_03745 [Streptomyces mirabilis]|uniref:hypothetical protein n=1 Tax=Streptomyces mirabilis TaxID=68239 RepID=UPI00340C35BC
MTRARREDQPTVEQVRHLIGNTEYGAITPDEAGRLRADVEHLIASQAGMAAKVSGLTRQLAAGARPVVDCPACQAPAASPGVTHFDHPTSGSRTKRLTAAALTATDNGSTT